MVEHSDPMSLGNTLVSATLEPVTSAENRVELAACIAGSTGAAFWPVIVPQAFSGDPMTPSPEAQEKGPKTGSIDDRPAQAKPKTPALAPSREDATSARSPSVVIAGGGFGGIEVAKALQDCPARVTVIGHCCTKLLPRRSHPPKWRFRYGGCCRARTRRYCSTR